MEIAGPLFWAALVVGFVTDVLGVSFPMIVRLVGKRVPEALVTAGTMVMLALIGSGIALLHLFLLVARSAMMPHRQFRPAFAMAQKMGRANFSA